MSEEENISTSLKGTNSSKFQVSEFILLGFPGIHSWQHWFSLPLALLYFSAIGANIFLLITICHDPALQQPMYHFLGILSLVDMGLATTIMPKILAILWFDSKVISLPECFAQIYAIHCFVGMESGIFLCMAFDRYVAICHPLRYPSIVTNALILKATLFMVLRNGLCIIPVPVLAVQRNYSSRNEIEHCLCSNLGVTSLACDDRRPNSICQLILAWLGMGSDLSLIILSYTLILHSVLKLKSAKAASKALSTCTSHLILILFFYTVVVVISVTHLAETKDTLIPVLLNARHNIIPPFLNPMVYALRTKELRAGCQKVFHLSLEKRPLETFFVIYMYFNFF
ncbi:olfactory receptor 56B1-like [Diceros bicornis minor]|uniref:olfactory receptor 56B1-like n=1 Tax=Diceros bicornis minor TaxID=77932 RepID=UPI0026EDC08F|nr:olfactory receptor 56B1-like [Diceros bicornis minor]